MSEALHPRRCWFQHTLHGIGPCEGVLQRAHLIRAQVIRREVGESFEIMWDPAVWVPGCVRHHRMLDHSRQIRIPRHLLPVPVETWAAGHGLGWWMDREYGAVSIEAGGSTPGTYCGEFGGTVQ